MRRIIVFLTMIGFFYYGTKAVYASNMDGKLVMKEKEVKISDAEGENMGYTPKIDKKFVQILHLKHYYTQTGFFSWSVRTDTIKNEIIMRDCGCN